MIDGRCVLNRWEKAKDFELEMDLDVKEISLFVFCNEKKTCKMWLRLLISFRIRMEKMYWILQKRIQRENISLIGQEIGAIEKHVAETNEEAIVERRIGVSSKSWRNGIDRRVVSLESPQTKRINNPRQLPNLLERIDNHHHHHHHHRIPNSLKHTTSTRSKRGKGKEKRRRRKKWSSNTFQRSNQGS